MTFNGKCHEFNKKCEVEDLWKTKSVVWDAGIVCHLLNIVGAMKCGIAISSYLSYKMVLYVWDKGQEAMSLLCQAFS